MFYSYSAYMKRDWLDRTTSLCSAGTFVLGLCFAVPAFANPEGGNVVAGGASIHNSGNILSITQHTDKAVIDWRNFDIDVGEHTEFLQPSANAMVLNRIKSQDPSHIAGQLSANGHVMLVNPNGILFDRGAQVDVHSLIATTSDIHNKDFMAGKLDFTILGNTNAAIVNAGTITAKDAGLGVVEIRI